MEQQKSRMQNGAYAQLEAERPLVNVNVPGVNVNIYVSRHV
jgi:hypothetical protein